MSTVEYHTRIATCKTEAFAECGVSKCIEVIVEQDDKLRRLFSTRKGHCKSIDDFG